MMRLPGGLVRDGELKREVRLREPDGELELLIGEASRRARSFQAGVSRVLAGVVEELDGAPLELAAAHELCVADRQFLMQRASQLLGLGHQWLTTSCLACAAPFEVEVDLDSLPVGDAGPGFPFAEVETARGALRLRVPNGADQIAIDGIQDRTEAERELLRRCVVEGELSSVLSDEDAARIDTALEAASPWVVTELAAQCPECKATRSVALDPYAVLQLSTRSIFDDVHTLALHYHWSERDILALPRERRQLYLARIDRARGLIS
jgi:hypothetical protein